MGSREPRSVKVDGEDPGDPADQRDRAEEHDNDEGADCQRVSTDQLHTFRDRTKELAGSHGAVPRTTAYAGGGGTASGCICSRPERYETIMAQGKNTRARAV